MRTFRIRSTVAAIAAAIPLSFAINAQANDQKPMSQSSAATTQSSAQQGATAQQRNDGNQQRDTLIGKDVYGAGGERVGEISDVVTKGGNTTAAIVDVGGFLGVGEKTVSIPMDQLQVGEDRVTATSLTEESAKNLPEYEERDRSAYTPLANDEGRTAWERESARDGAASGAANTAASANSQEANRN